MRAASANEAYDKRASEVGADVMRKVEKAFLLHVLDTNWREHLQQLDHLRSVIGLRGYGQRDPINEFKTEAYALFETLIDGLRRDVVRMLMHVQVAPAAPSQPLAPGLAPKRAIPMTETHVDPVTGENEMEMADAGARSRFGSAGLATLSAKKRATHVDAGDPATWGAVPRNAPCPCGSGKKYKQCHGRHG